MTIEKFPIKETAEAVKGIVEAVPVYEDAAQPAAQEVGKALGTVAGAINASLAPLRLYIWGMDRIEGWVKETLEEKLKDVPPERIVTPKPTVAGPLVEAMRFAGEEPDLREMYANLLATSMDSETASSAHPAYVEIIKQLTPDEAKIVSLLPKQYTFPVISVMVGKRESMGVRTLVSGLCLLAEQAKCEHDYYMPTYLANLQRLNMVEIIPGAAMVNDEYYTELENHEYTRLLIEHCEEQERVTWKIERGVGEATHLCKSFCKACVSPPTSDTDSDQTIDSLE